VRSILEGLDTGAVRPLVRVALELVRYCDVAVAAAIQANQAASSAQPGQYFLFICKRGMVVNISQTHSAALTVNISQYQLESYLSLVTPYHSVINLVLNLLCAILPFSKT
jgi:hypothetical protein